MDPMGMASGAVASGNLLVMKKAMDTQENLMLGLLSDMEQTSQSLASNAPVTGVNTSTTGGLDIRI